MKALAAKFHSQTGCFTGRRMEFGLGQVALTFKKSGLTPKDPGGSEGFNDSLTRGRVQTGVGHIGQLMAGQGSQPLNQIGHLVGLAGHLQHTAHPSLCEFFQLLNPRARRPRTLLAKTITQG